MPNRLQSALACGAALALSLTGLSAFASSSGASVSGFASRPDDKSKYDVDFKALGMNVIERAGLADKPLEEITPEDLLERSFLTLRLGIFDLGISKHASEDREKADHFIQLGHALLDTQAAFLKWLGDKAPGHAQAKKDMATLKSYLKSLRKEAVAGVDKDGRGEITALMPPSDKVLEAQERFGKYMASGEALGLERQGELVEPILLAPDRREFLELLSSFGLLYPDQEYIYHSNDVLDWTNTYCNDLTVVALEFAELGSSTSGAFGGVSMNSRTSTGMAQQISQLSAVAMLDNLYGSKIPPSLAGAFAVNLVIDVFGECNTRVDGDLNSRRTEAREVFVPGGNPDGGILPPLMADSRWRAGHGADHYLVGLQMSQSAGESEAKGKRNARNEFFEIKNEDENDSMYLKAPFLGSLAAERNLIIPDAYFGDAQEMFRAYRTAFAYWLQTEAMSKKKGEKAFADLLIKLAQAEPTDGALEKTIEEIYGKPLTAADPEEDDDLEGSFLTWLSKI
ncbi:hypothetical protein Poly30_42990 [Planctomycetes bacterium Poly30]|uniref:Uncharacterized protein n=1 Tax=Saltatorellus ferox TaxID=2528018 RepID=A0A518EXC8_9BACT|nr:hypothetical protein Poly30_42990 [Planctomycetes bacterium Poly30]